MRTNRSIFAVALIVALVALSVAACDRDPAPAADLSATSDLIAGPDLRPSVDLSGAADLAAGDDLSPVPDLSRAADQASGVALEGDPCGQSANGLACAANLACCYPCGRPGCDWKCQQPCAPGPGCQGGCPLLP